MTEQLKNVLWMTEELMEVSPDRMERATESIAAFLDSTANSDLTHRIIQSDRNLELLQDRLATLHKQRPFTLAIDLTHGKMSNQLDVFSGETPIWADFAMSRTRLATDPSLPTSGHIVSHNPEEIRSTLIENDTSNILVLDDTSFSGATSLIAEGLVRNAFPDRDISFTHGFLILNIGDLGPQPGAQQRIETSGSVAVGGMQMETPPDDGWHFFDIVKQQSLPEHLAAVMELLRISEQPGSEGLIRDFMQDEANQNLLFPERLSLDTLAAKQKLGHFVASQTLSGLIHVRNPQLLPNIIAQGHLRPPTMWGQSETETLRHLLDLGTLIAEGSNHA